MTITNNPRDIARSLRRYGPLRDLIKVVGPPPVQRRDAVNKRFTYLVRSIVYQQLAGAAASAIYTRLAGACAEGVVPAGIDGLRDDELSAFGLSGAKRAAIRDLTRHVDAGTVRLDRHGRWRDDDVMDDLVKVRGIGPWTVHMYQMGSLGCPDVWPTGDYGVRAGWSLLHDLDPMITPKELAIAAAPLAPHRSAVAWYCWEAVNLSRATSR